MVLTFGNAQIWLGTPPVVLKFVLVFLHFCSAIASLRKVFVIILTLEE